MLNHTDHRQAVLVLSLGGTIAMTSANGGEGVAPTLDGEDLVGAVPQLAELGAIETVAYRRMPGGHLKVDDLIEMAEFITAKLSSGEVAGVVITQGTDTIEETAFLLDLLLEEESPVIVTGAMRNPSTLSADGAANLYGAVKVALSSAARGMGVLVVFNDEIHSARFVQKTHTSNPSAFVSVTGPLGWIIEGEPKLMMRPNREIRFAGAPGSKQAPVALITASLDDDGRILAALPSLGFKGAVIEALGGGHVPDGFVEKLEPLAAVMPVVFSSRVGAGEILRRTYDFPGSEVDLRSKGAIPAGWLDGPKARMLLTLLLRSGFDREEVAQVFEGLSSNPGQLASRHVKGA